MARNSPTCGQFKPHNMCGVLSRGTYLAGSKVTKARGPWLLLEQGPIQEALETGAGTHCSPGNLYSLELERDFWPHEEQGFKMRKWQLILFAN